MAGVVASRTATGSATTPTTPGVPPAQVVALTDGEGALLGSPTAATLITAVGATATQTGADRTNTHGRGVVVVLDMTSAGTGSVTLTIQGKDPASGKYYTLLAGAAVTTNSTNVYTVYPGIAAAANVAANAPLPRTWRVVATANNANPTSYTVGASVVV